MLPPRLIRRLLLAPLTIVIAIVLVVLFPLLALVTAAFGLARLPFRGRMRGLRVLWFAVVWLTAETLALFACLALWVMSGFGRRMRAEPSTGRHYAVMRWFLALIYRVGTSTFGVRVEVDEPEPTPEERIARLASPVIVLSRHAGPGDSFLLVHHLLNVYGRRPRLVLKADLQLDPTVDVVLNRLPNVFISRRKAGEGRFAEGIRDLASGLDAASALVIFPEGGNWSPGRWRRSIQRLRHKGRPDLAARASRMPNVLAPRTGGVLAAIEASAGADVIFVAHAGLDTLVKVSEIWRELPIDQVVRAKWWRVPDDQVPRQASREAQIKWLYDWWQLIDGWISENRGLTSHDRVAGTHDNEHLRDRE
jgi:1-acyl-sn-glycerol-3-phosphate acyltransferase